MADNLSEDLKQRILDNFSYLTETVEKLSKEINKLNMDIVEHSVESKGTIKLYDQKLESFVTRLDSLESKIRDFNKLQGEVDSLVKFIFVIKTIFIAISPFILVLLGALVNYLIGKI